MRKVILYTGLIVFLLNSLYAQTKSWTSKDAQVSFFSSAPLEDIEAISKTGVSALNTTTGDIIFKVWNTTFQFEKKLMQEHFNENYMESERYPISEFRGKITDSKKLEKDGQYELNIAGMLNIHGIAKQYNTKAKIYVGNNTITAVCNFDVRLADHNIKIPSVVGKNIAEVVQVKITATFRQKNQEDGMHK